MTYIVYIVFKSFIQEGTWCPNEELEYIIAETTSEVKARELQKDIENMGERAVIQMYQVVREDGFKRYVLMNY